MLKLGFRPLIALTAVTATLGVLYRLFLAPHADRAVLGYALVTLNAPIDGKVTAMPAETDRPSSADAGAFTLLNERVDTTHLAALKATAAKLKVNTEALNAAYASIKELSNSFGGADRNLRATQTLRLQNIAEQFGLELQAKQAEVTAAQANLSRSDELLRSGIATQREREAALVAYEAAHAQLDVTQKQWDNAKLLADSVSSGKALDVSAEAFGYARQRADELRVFSVGRHAELAAVSAEYDAVQAQLAAEEARVAALEHASVPLTVGSRLWRRLTANGNYVLKGQPLAEYLDCSRPVVTAVLPVRTLSKVTGGTRAKIRGPTLPRVLKAHVTGFVGLSPQFTPIAPTLPPAAYQAKPNSVDEVGVVLLSLDESDLPAVARPCPIGGYVDVDFEL